MVHTTSNRGVTLNEWGWGWHVFCKNNYLHTTTTLIERFVFISCRFTEVTPMDIYIGVCFMYVVAALVEMAIVGYFDKPRYTLAAHIRSRPSKPSSPTARRPEKHPVGVRQCNSSSRSCSPKYSCMMSLNSESPESISVVDGGHNQMTSSSSFSTSVGRGEREDVEKERDITNNFARNAQTSKVSCSVDLLICIVDLFICCIRHFLLVTFRHTLYFYVAFFHF